MILASNIVNDHQMTVSCCADGEKNTGGGRAAPLTGETVAKSTASTAGALAGAAPVALRAGGRSVTSSQR